MEQNFNPYTTPPEGGLPNQIPTNGTPPISHVIVKPNYFEKFAFGFSIASLVGCSIIYLAYLFAGFAILLAVLSRGPQMKFSTKAKRSIFLGICGIVLATILFVASLLILLEEYGSIEGILRAGSEMMDINFEEEFGILFQ
jgi:hypothetical protein